MDCLSPDLVAAWMDGTLSREERAAAEAHASDCAHCQAMLAAMARTAPARPQSAWWKTPAVRWMVPLTATAALVLTVVTIGRVSRRPVRDDVAVAERTTPAAPSAAVSPESRAAAPERAAVEDATRESAKNVAQRREAVAPRADDRGAVAGAVGADAIDALASQKTTATAPGAPPPLPDSSTGVAALPAESAGPPVTPPPTAVATPQPAPVTTPLPLQETVTVTAAPAAESVRRNVPARATAARPVEVVSTDRAYRWRAIEPGSVIFSMDGGFTWRPSATGTSVALHAGSAPSRQVCWFVGQLGTVLLTTDGTNWQLRPFPERVDLTGVRATDARNAVVTTANRRRFATSDGGATWSPLQED